MKRKEKGNNNSHTQKNTTNNNNNNINIKMKFTTSTLTALSLFVYQANNIVIAHGQISCTSIYEPVLCGNNEQDWFSNECLAIQGGYKNPDKDCHEVVQDDCNQLTDVISLMEEKFGQVNCDEFSAFPQGLTVTCSIKDGTGRGAITAKLNAPYNKDDIATPSDIALSYGGGIVGNQPIVEFSNDCTGNDLRNVQDLLKDIKNDIDNTLPCPAVYEPVACGQNLIIFSNQCKANIAQFNKNQCTCYEKYDIMFLMEEKMGVNNCAYNTDDDSLYKCKNAKGQTASLYSSEVEMPESLFFAADGGSNTDVVLFENDCNDLTDTVTFFAKNGM